MTLKKPIDEQGVVVTGASSGLGRAIGRSAGVQGAKVVREAEAGRIIRQPVRDPDR